VPGNAQSVISQAQPQIGAALTTANSDIATTNADANSAVSIANGWSRVRRLDLSTD